MKGNGIAGSNAVSRIASHANDATSPSVLRSDFTFILGEVVRPKAELDLYHFLTALRLNLFVPVVWRHGLLWNKCVNRWYETPGCAQRMRSRGQSGRSHNGSLAGDVEGVEDVLTYQSCHQNPPFALPSSSQACANSRSSVARDPQELLQATAEQIHRTESL